jgi:alpha-amylase/alpha-mannosidase (GH57 family)
MKSTLPLLHAVLLTALIATACGTPPSPAPTLPAPTTSAVTETPAAGNDLLYVNLMWHNHQPFYTKDENGVYTRPWVRVHATKDYYDMAAVLKDYPNVQVTFNMTPVLIRQLDDYADGAKDLYWTVAEKPASELTEDDRRFILTRFFDVNWTHIVARFPRYQELLDKRTGTTDEAIAAALQSFTEQDYRDLQVWFNLAWFDPDFLALDPLKSLVDQGKDFGEEDKAVVFDEAKKTIAGIMPLYKEMQESGQIEVTTTPYAHPILPLIFDTNLALVGNPAAELPDQGFSYPTDAKLQLERSVEVYQDHFGTAPRGLWPGEGAVAQDVVPLVANAGYQWMATGEPVLAQSLGIGNFTRDGKETVQQADDLYRPYYVVSPSGKRVAAFFRDGTLSDKIGFTYSGVDGDTAATDLIRRLENIRQELKDEGAAGPHVVSIILDGENAWENYNNDAKDFFHALYGALNESTTLKTVTPSQYLEMFPEQRKITNLFPGAWFSPNYDTWIGEPEERTAWDYLARVRKDLQKYEQGIRNATPDQIKQAQDAMLLAEGSDWFWWYGADQDSGQDAYFDQAYRALLANVYKSVGAEVPSFVEVPIIAPAPAEADQQAQGLSTPTIDGKSGPDEWASAALFTSGAAAAGTSLAYTFDAQSLYARVMFNQPLAQGSRIGLYLLAPHAGEGYPFTRAGDGETPILLGVPATHLFEWGGQSLNAYTAGPDGWEPAQAIGEGAIGTDTFEAAIPWTALGTELEAGDEFRLMAAILPSGTVMPASGPARVVMPDLGTSTVVLQVDDPDGDDNGPGTYTYPTDSVFKPRSFDLKSFIVSYDDKNMIFKFAFNGPVPNPWGSPNNLAIQTLDVYVDKDPGAGTGERKLFPGRNAALEAGNGWDIAVWAEGWTPAIVEPDPQGVEPKPLVGVDFKILVDEAARTVTVRVPRDAFGDGDPTTWGYVGLVLGQEGYPAQGVWRVRDVNEQQEQWRFGGSPTDTNHTRIIDLAWAGDPDQSTILSTYTASTAEASGLSADDFAQVPLILAK